MRIPLSVILLLACINLYCKNIYFQRIDQKDGLAHNTVNSIIQDSRGFMWFGSKDGLNRYDGNTFKIYRHVLHQTSGIGNSQIRCMTEDSEMKLWVGTNSGLYVYDMQTDSFSCPLTDNGGMPLSNSILNLEKDIAENIWIMVEGRGIFCKRHDSDSIVCRYDKKKIIRTLKSDRRGRIWFSCANDGLYYTDDGFENVSPFLLENGEKILNKDIISDICFGDYNNIYLGLEQNGIMELDLFSRRLKKIELAGDNSHMFVRKIIKYSDDELWIGSESGIYIFNIRTGLSSNLRASRFDRYSLSDNSIHSLYMDDEGGLWIGSFFGGVNYLPKRNSDFDKYYYTLTKDSLKGQRVKEICSDKNGMLWIGTEDAGLYQFNPKTGRFDFFEPSRQFSNIHGLLMNGDELWVSTFSSGLKVIDTKTLKIRHYDNAMKHGRLFSNNVYSIEKTKEGRIYIGTMHGLQYYRPESDDFGYISKINGGKMVNDIMEDSDGNLWVATASYGLFRYDPREGRWIQFQHGAESGSLANNNITSIFEDSRKCIWCTTQGYGFCRYEPQTDTFTKFDSSIGLPSDLIYQIVEDESGYFWITTNDGLVLFNRDEERIERIYTTEDGLLSNQFNYMSSHRSEDGKIWFGCNEGLISFNPSELLKNRFKSHSRIYITDFATSDSKTGKNSLQYVSGKETMILKHYQNSFKIRIANLCYRESASQRLEYLLKGHENSWNTWTGKEISYTSLPPGEYIFQVRMTGSDDDPVSLSIRIQPPIWKSQAAMSAYIILILIAIYISIRISINLNRKKRHQYIYDMSVRKEKELYDEKISFFTNITHEIRTPVTLIKAPLENILERNDLSKDIVDDLRIMNKNTNRLLVLINQILDFEKIEKKGMSLNMAEHDITDIVSDTYSRFQSSLRQLHKSATIQMPEERIKAIIDSEALTKILSNLFSNAMKYSDKEIHIVLSKGKDSFTIEVSNDGTIVPADKREAIFMPFYRYGKEYVHAGTGIGLSLSRSLAELHNGTLRMDTDTSVNRFVLTVPTGSAALKQDLLEYDNILADIESADIDNQKEEISDEKVILIVEDDKDMREFIRKTIARIYKVMTAPDGSEAMNILRKNNISLIISDLMMPNMDGLEFCKKVKEDIRTSHIPLILLTAKTNLESKITSMDAGADAYLEKPFSTSYLMSVVANQIAIRQKLKEAFMENPLVTNSTVNLSESDSLFLTKLQKIINDNISNTDINMNDIAHMMFMSRANFYNKIKGMMDMTPNEYLRLTRLKKAAQLLSEGKMPINEICYMAGFSSTSYFSKCFFKQYGVLPKNYMKNDNNRKQ